TVEEYEHPEDAAESAADIADWSEADCTEPEWQAKKLPAWFEFELPPDRVEAYGRAGALTNLAITMIVERTSSRDIVKDISVRISKIVPDGIRVRAVVEGPQPVIDYIQYKFNSLQASHDDERDDAAEDTEYDRP